MPIYCLPEEPVFPDPNEASKEGLLAIGGDLSAIRILNAYCNGIFPWYAEDDPIMWWSPDPRMVVFTEKYTPRKKLLQSIRNKNFELKINHNFRSVISMCQQTSRKDQDGTWITDEMRDAYIDLHTKGYAHSFETYCSGKLVGGLYGLKIGRIFFGESMFHIMSNASKYAFINLIMTCKKSNIPLIDCQQETKHLKSLGAENIDRKRFTETVRKLCLEDSSISSFE